MSNSSPASSAVTQPAPNRFWTGCFALILLLLAASFWPAIRTPWVEDDNYFDSLYAQAAHNNLRAGLSVTAGVPATLYFGPLPIPAGEYYVHHPTLLPLMVTGAFAMFGETEWAARLVPIACSLLSVLFLWLLVADTAGCRAATLAAFVFAALPMELHYGDTVNFEQCATCFMLATLLCLCYWWAGKGSVWAALSLVAAFLALWVDWPAYLLCGIIIACFLFRREKAARMYALALCAVCGVSLAIFLLQIHRANPDALTDLWTALKMRVGNGVATGSSAAEMRETHFTMAKWFSTIFAGIHADFLITPWLLAAAGVVFVLGRWKSSSGIRWLAWAAAVAGVAGAAYVVIFRNESYIHDFATYYLMIPVAIFGGLCIEGVFKMLELSPFPRAVIYLLLFAGLGWLGYSGYTQSQKLRSPFNVLDGSTPEPQNLIPDLGARLAKTFPEQTLILCNFDPYTSVLQYYTQRSILNNLTSYDDWRSAMSNNTESLGGVIWLDAPQSGEILAALPKDEVTPFDLDGFHFAIWKRGKQ